VSDLHRDYVERTDQVRADLAFGAAWRRVEAALPESSWFQLVEVYDGWRADVLNEFTTTIADADGLTPTEALTKLAEALEARHGS
jgi:hypothetical protein